MQSTAARGFAKSKKLRSQGFGLDPDLIREIDPPRPSMLGDDSFKTSREQEAFLYLIQGDGE